MSHPKAQRLRKAALRFAAGETYDAVVGHPPFYSIDAISFAFTAMMIVNASYPNPEEVFIFAHYVQSLTPNELDTMFMDAADKVDAAYYGIPVPA